MPNYDPDYTPSGLRLINTGNIPNDSAADPIFKAVEKLNTNTQLLEVRSQRLAYLEKELEGLLSGSPTFKGKTTSSQLVVDNEANFKGDVFLKGTLNSTGLATFQADATFNRVLYCNGLLLVQDPDEKDNSNRAPSTRWVRKEISRVVQELKGLTLDDLEDYAQLSGAVFKGPLKAPTLPLTAAATDDVATAAYTQRYLSAQLKSYAPLANAQLVAAKVSTPAPDSLDDLVVNAFWVNEFVEGKVGEISDGLTAVGTSITAFQTELAEVSQLSAETATVALIGSVVIATRAAAEPGWLIANGTAVSETLYPQYFALVGHNYDQTGSPPPAGMFSLPNWTEEVTRLRALNGVSPTAPLNAYVYVGAPA